MVQNKCVTVSCMCLVSFRAVHPLSLASQVFILFVLFRLECVAVVVLVSSVWLARDCLAFLLFHSAVSVQATETWLARLVESKTRTKTKPCKDIGIESQTSDFRRLFLMIQGPFLMNFLFDLRPKRRGESAALLHLSICGQNTRVKGARPSLITSRFVAKTKG